MMGVRLFAITVLASTAVAMGCGFAHRGPENLDAADMEKCTKVYGAARGSPAYAYGKGLGDAGQWHLLHWPNRRPLTFNLSDAAPSVIELAGDEWPTRPDHG